MKSLDKILDIRLDTCHDKEELFQEYLQIGLGTGVGSVDVTSKPYSLESKAKTDKGNICRFFTNGKVSYERDKIVTLVGTIRDINQQRKIQEKLEQERSKRVQNAKQTFLGENFNEIFYCNSNIINDLLL